MVKEKMQNHRYPSVGLFHAQNNRYSVSKEEYEKILKGLSHEIDFKNFDKNLQNLV
jgi:hypothetical protein